MRWSATAAQVGAEALRTLAAYVEDLAKTADARELRTAVDQLNAAALRTIAQLHAYLHERGI